MKNHIFLLLVLTGLILACSKKPEEHQKDVATSEESAGDGPFFQQAIVYCDIYKAGDPDKALSAMLDDVTLTMNAKESDITPFWKNQYLAFTKTRIYMILKYLGRDDEAGEYLESALNHINLWLKEGGREVINEEKLISIVIDADQGNDLPWHPKID
ncbi:MAG: hypothetical protein ACK5JP_02735 [Akkermansiaceae bacterium]|jgi:hypothetical protein